MTGGQRHYRLFRENPENHPQGQGQDGHAPSGIEFTSGEDLWQPEEFVVL